MKKIFFLFLVFIFILNLSFIFAQSEEQKKVLVSVYDLDENPIENVVLQIIYGQFLNNSLISKSAEGLSSKQGQWEASLFFEPGSKPEQYFTLYYYHPLSSAKSIFYLDPYSPTSNAKIIIQKPFLLFKLGLFKNSTPIQNAKVWFIRPYVFSTFTDKTGYVAFRFPKNSILEGWVEYENLREKFKFYLNESSHVQMVYPFKNPLPILSNETFDFIPIQILKGDGKPFTNSAVVLEMDGLNSTYFTDSLGMIYILGSPSSNLTLYYYYMGQILEKKLNLKESAEFKIFIPKFLSLEPPLIEYIGQSCYNVKVKISEPRKGIINKVVAKALDSNESILLTLEQNQILLNQSKLIFYKIFCVDKDTYFDIVASSEYENVSARIQLLKREDETSTIQEAIIPPSIRAKEQEAKKIELLIILSIILFILILVYMFIKFKAQAFFIYQSISRFIRNFYYSRKKEK